MKKTLTKIILYTSIILTTVACSSLEEREKSLLNPKNMDMNAQVYRVSLGALQAYIRLNELSPDPKGLTVHCGSVEEYSGTEIAVMALKRDTGERPGPVYQSWIDEYNKVFGCN